jgi:hypothetical protein
MSIKKSVPTYMMRLSSSRIEKYITLSLYGGLTAITLVLPLFWCLPLMVALNITVLFLFIKPAKYTHLTTQEDGSLLLEDRAGNTRCVYIQQESVIYPFLIVLYVRHAYRESILLWPDSTDATALRHLRIWLYWYWPTLNFSMK